MQKTIRHDIYDFKINGNKIAIGDYFITPRASIQFP